MLRSLVVYKQKTAYEMLRSLVGSKQKTAYEMLRSLVGSEMCIRDSRYHSQPEARRHADEPQSVDPVLQLVDLDAHCAQPHQHPAAQPLGRGVVAAAPGNQRLDLPLEAVLAQTGRALVQVHADLAAVVVGYLTVEVEVNLLDHLSTVGLVWTTE